MRFNILICLLALLPLSLFGKETLNHCSRYELVGKILCQQNKKKKVFCKIKVFPESRSEITLDLEGEIDLISRFHKSTIQINGRYENKSAKNIFKVDPYRIKIKRPQYNQFDLREIAKNDCK